MKIRLNNVSGLAAYQPRLVFDQTTLDWLIIYTMIEIVFAPTNLRVCTISDFLNVNKGRAKNLHISKSYSFILLWLSNPFVVIQTALTLKHRLQYYSAYFHIVNYINSFRSMIGYFRKSLWNIIILFRFVKLKRTIFANKHFWTVRIPKSVTAQPDIGI